MDLLQMVQNYWALFLRVILSFGGLQQSHLFKKSSVDENDLFVRTRTRFSTRHSAV
jgi:hypothetical protein